MPNEPDCDYMVQEIIKVFYLADRGRGYLSGMSVSPMPLTVQNISEVVAVYPSVLDRELLDGCVFDIDDEYLALARA